MDCCIDNDIDVISNMVSGHDFVQMGHVLLFYIIVKKESDSCLV